jgi:phosphoribosylformylglycinamidine synthase
MSDSGPRALVVRTAGTNCEHETADALARCGARAEILRFDRLLAEPARLEDTRILVFAGGFSHGDDVAAGRVWGLEMRSALGEQLRAYTEAGGLTLGVCNGFQVLVESGIFEPDRSPAERSIALYANASNHYECRWVTLAERECACPWITPGALMPTPVAHAEGRFVVRDDASWNRLVEQRQIALVYVDPGGPGDLGDSGAGEIGYPANPNGSLHHVAGICDPSGRVLGLMPHPERNVTPWQHPNWTRLGKRAEGEGLGFYRRLVESAAAAPV